MPRLNDTVSRNQRRVKLCVSLIASTGDEGAPFSLGGRTFDLSAFYAYKTVSVYAYLVYRQHTKVRFFMSKRPPRFSVLRAPPKYLPPMCVPPSFVVLKPACNVRSVSFL